MVVDVYIKGPTTIPVGCLVPVQIILTDRVFRLEFPHSLFSPEAKSCPDLLLLSGTRNSPREMTCSRRRQTYTDGRTYGTHTRFIPT